MPHNPDFKYYVLKGEALEMLDRYRARIHQNEEDTISLQEEFRTRLQFLRNEANTELREMWTELANAVGVDPDESWGNDEYGIEFRFIDAGFGALLYSPRRSAFEEIFGAMGTETPGVQESSDDPMKDFEKVQPPKGKKLN